jgi:hypothetical protein
MGDRIAARLENLSGRLPAPALWATFALPSLDQPAFERNRPNADKLIDLKSSERAFREKPGSTFSQRALAFSGS